MKKLRKWEEGCKSSLPEAFRRELWDRLASRGRVEIENSGSEEIVIDDLDELSRKTGLILRLVDSAALSSLFEELEKYDHQERAETFECLKHALNETRRSVGAEPIYPNE